ncbi:MAG: DMT family transporter [Candidatus Krumholzibacteriota bacterium]|nr:DMT family transporter [Candidatus Krumholzibacteriota bacterium]
MERRRFESESLLLLAAAIWGFAFVAQRVGMRYTGPFLFNGIRFLLGALVLLPIAVVIRRREAAIRGAGAETAVVPADRAMPAYHGGTAAPAAGGPRRARWTAARAAPAGILAGAILFCGASLQQVGIVSTTAGNAGFITGLYVVFVPLLGLFAGHRPGGGTWAGALLAAAGMYLLSVRGGLRMSPGDALVFASALCFAFHVLVIGWASPRSRPIELAMTQFAFVGLASLAVALAREPVDAGGLLAAAPAILYGGALSVGVAYTLQVVAQRRARPAHAAIILGMEAVFAAFGGWLLLGESIPPRGLVGCAAMLAGIVLSQLSEIRRAPGPGPATHPPAS